MPLQNSSRIRIDWPQKTSFWPALYLPSSGRPSSLLLITAPRFFIHDRVVAVPEVEREEADEQTEEADASTTPIQGWMMRVIWPPPNRPVRKNSEGWNSARPLSASRINETAVIQWLMRAAVV